MKLGVTIALLALLATYFTVDRSPSYTDIDYLFSQYSSDELDLQYSAKCPKPKTFRGFRKYRVSCFEVYKQEGFEELALWRSHSGPFWTLSQSGWRFVASEDQKTGIRTQNAVVQHSIIFEKTTKKPGCNRRIYAKFSWNPEDRSSQPGDKLYIADPYTLFCDDARILIDT